MERRRGGGASDIPSFVFCTVSRELFATLSQSLLARIAALLTTVFYVFFKVSMCFSFLFRKEYHQQKSWKLLYRKYVFIIGLENVTDFLDVKLKDLFPVRLRLLLFYSG